MNQLTAPSRPTVYDVARECGVTYTTVSNVLNGKGRVSDKTRAAVLRTARDLNYQINPHAQRLATGKSGRTISLFASELDFGIGTQKIKAIQRALSQEGYDVPIHSYGSHELTRRSDPAAALRSFCQQRPLAVVCNTDNFPSEAVEVLVSYQAAGGIVVGYDHHFTDYPFDRVVFDGEDNTYQAARHLLEQGHRRVGLFIIGWERRPGGPRLEGFLRAMGEYGVVPREEWLFPGLPDEPAEAGGVQLARQFLAMKDRPTGLCIVNDHSALTFIIELQRAGVSVPGEVSVVGHDDVLIARYSPVPVTSVSHPADEIAALVVQYLMERLNGATSTPPRQTTVRGVLVLRDSVARPAEF